jgi:hypothetical protein
MSRPTFIPIDIKIRNPKDELSTYRQNYERMKEKYLQ